MKQTVTLTASPRSETGKGAARTTRRSGRVPAVVYGHGREPAPLTVSAFDLDKVLQDAGGSTVIDLTVEGSATVKTLIREVQRHPILREVTHIDFYEIHAGEAIRVDVPLHLVGSPEGVRNTGGVLEQFLREVEIEVLPKNIPDHVELDVTDLKVTASLHVSDLEIPNAKILLDPSTTVCTIAPPRVEEEPVAATEEIEEETTEPELIRKQREEEEEGGEEA